MKYLDEFLSYCNLNLVQPMYEAVGRAYVTLLKPAMQAIFEAAGKTPREATKDAILEFLVSHTKDGKVTKTALATVGDDDGKSNALQDKLHNLRNDIIATTITDAQGNTRRVLDVIEEAVLGYIQRYGRTGSALRAGTDQLMHTRVSLAMSGKLATAMLAYEPGIARILLEDLHGARALLGPDLYEKICDAVDMYEPLNERCDESRLNRFGEFVLPTFIRHNSRNYVGDGATEWSRIPNLPTLNGDFGYVSGKDRTLIGLDDMERYADSVSDIQNPTIGDMSNKSNANANSPTVSPTYDIYYMPSTSVMDKFIKSPENQHPSIFLSGISRFGDEDRGPWCISDDSYHWNTYGHYSSRTMRKTGNGDMHGSVYVLLRKGWRDLPTASMKQTSAGRQELIHSCIACIMTHEGTCLNACGRDDNYLENGDVNGGCDALLRELLQVPDLSKVMPWRGEEGENLKTWIVNGGAGESAAPTPMALPNKSVSDSALVDGINRVLAYGYTHDPEINVRGVTFHRINDNSTNVLGNNDCVYACHSVLRVLRSAGVNVEIYVADADQPKICIINGQDGKYSVFGNTLFSDVALPTNAAITGIIYVKPIGESKFRRISVKGMSDTGVTSDVGRCEFGMANERYTARGTDGKQYNLTGAYIRDHGNIYKAVPVVTENSTADSADIMVIYTNNDGFMIGRVYVRQENGDYLSAADARVQHDDFADFPLTIKRMSKKLMVVNDVDGEYYVVTIDDAGVGTIHGPYNDNAVQLFTGDSSQRMAQVTDGDNVIVYYRDGHSEESRLEDAPIQTRFGVRRYGVR